MWIYFSATTHVTCPTPICVFYLAVYVSKEARRAWVGFYFLRPANFFLCEACVVFFYPQLFLNSNIDLPVYRTAITAGVPLPCFVI